MNFEHVSVMLMPTVDMLNVREDGIYVDGTLGGGNAGPVPVVGENGIFEVAGEQLGVLLGEGGAQRSHCVVKPRLMQGDGVHIALGEDDPARF